MELDLNPWLETLGACLLAGLGVLLGYWFSRLPKPYWLLGYFIPLVVVIMIGSTRRYSALEFIPPMSWLVAGRTEYALGGFIGTMILTTPLSRVPHPRDRIMVMIFMVMLVALSSVWPFLAPAFNRNYLFALQTKIDADGICRQSTEYNCGPAAAVTALRKLGFPAEEGPIAIAAHTSNAIGTPPDLLHHALRKLYPTNGLVCEYRHFKSVSDLTNGGITLAVIKFGLLVDHYVAVLEVTDREVVVGDPFAGKAIYTPEQFARKWRYAGVVLKRET